MSAYCSEPSWRMRRGPPTTGEESQAPFTAVQLFPLLQGMTRAATSALCPMAALPGSHAKGR